MYATLKAQSIDEGKFRIWKGELGSFKSKVGEKSPTKSVWFGVVYGCPTENTKLKPFNRQREAKTFRDSFYICVKSGLKRSSSLDCKSNRNEYREDSPKVLKAINALSKMEKAADVMNELEVQYGE